MSTTIPINPYLVDMDLGGTVHTCVIVFRLSLRPVLFVYGQGDEPLHVGERQTTRASGRILESVPIGFKLHYNRHTFNVYNMSII